MKNYLILGIICMLFQLPLTGQGGELDIKVYDFEEGLSHRNVFKIRQDTSGFIWIATINGLNRFDGYEFQQYNTRSTPNRIPFDAITDMFIDENNQIWMANPDYLSILDPTSNRTRQIKIKDGNIIRRESLVPHNLYEDQQGRIWMAAYSEKTATTSIQYIEGDSTVKEILTVEGKYTKRPIRQVGDAYYVAAFENELWKIDEAGNILEKFTFPYPEADRSNGRVVHMQVVNNTLYVLLANGRIYLKEESSREFTEHPVNKELNGRRSLAYALMVEENGDVWIGGQGVLWYYDALEKRLTNYDNPIRQLIKNTCTYRQIFRDRSDVIWIATDFGAIKLIQSENLFSHYLSGGSEYCSNVYCSTRGITEDEEGRIYISYYNSIHVLDPRTNAIRLLFPSNDFFNFPFGITYHQGALWTGNGRRIDLRDFHIDTLFQHPNIDMGAVMVDKDQQLWFGYQQWLYQYDPEQKILKEFSDNSGKWDSLNGQISYLYQGKTGDYIWASTLGAGVYKIDKQKGRLTSYHAGADSRAQLLHNQVNATYEDSDGNLWLATAVGLHKLNITTEALQIYTTKEGLPNNFINGILSEGDSILWLSTDNGICRFDPSEEKCTNFFVQDGLSANEFNRMSFYQSREGRMYFGGLNGINAFYPSRKFQARREEQKEAQLLFTNFTKLDGETETLITQHSGLNTLKEIILAYDDKIFSFNFALSDYHHPAENIYSYMLEDFEKDWSPPSSINSVRYNNIPAGIYTFRVRARVNKYDWNKDELAIKVIIQEAYYNTWWFWILCGLVLLGTALGLHRYRVYQIEKREHELEALVKARTLELEEEKQKSEELLLNILPADMAEELKRFGSAKAKRHNKVSVMFSDFKGFSKISEQLDPEILVAEIDQCFRGFDEITDEHGLEKIKTVGDAYLCVAGISSESDVPDAVRVVEAALEIQRFMASMEKEKKPAGNPYFEARIGIHTGPVVAGIVGIKKFAYDIWGDTVNIASRMETYGDVGRVNISEATYQLVKDYYNCSYHGDFTENNTDIPMYFIESRKAGAPPSLSKKQEAPGA